MFFQWQYVGCNSEAYCTKLHLICVAEISSGFNEKAAKTKRTQRPQRELIVGSTSVEQRCRPRDAGLVLEQKRAT